MNIFDGKRRRDKSAVGDRIYICDVKTRSLGIDCTIKQLMFT